MALQIGGAVFALLHAQILGVDVGNGDAGDLKQFGGCRVLLGKAAVGHDVFAGNREAIVLAIGQRGLGLLDVAAQIGQGGEGHLQPAHFLAGAQHAADPIGRPGVVEDGLASAEAL